MKELNPVLRRGRNCPVIIDSDTAIRKIEPFVAACARGVQFLVDDQQFEHRVLEYLRELGQQYHVRITVADKSAAEMLSDVARFALVGAVAGAVVFAFTPLGFTVCIVGGATFGALAAVVDVTVERRLDGRLIVAI